MDDLTDVPEGVGPHEGRELELMLSGAKPLSMFSDVVPPSFEWPEAEFDVHVEKGAIVKREYLGKTRDEKYTIRYVYFALPGEEWRIDAAHEINVNPNAALPEAGVQDDIEIGRLLGYSDQQIRVFLEWSRSRL